MWVVGLVEKTCPASSPTATTSAANSPENRLDGGTRDLEKRIGVCLRCGLVEVMVLSDGSWREKPCRSTSRWWLLRPSTTSVNGARRVPRSYSQRCSSFQRRLDSLLPQARANLISPPAS